MNNNSIGAAIKKNFEPLIFIVSLSIVYLLSLYSYLLFHSLAEMFYVSIAFAIFILVWISRRIIDNNFFIFLGISLLFVSIFDIVHLLAYKGMGVFPGFDANLPTQLWIVARYMQSLSFIAAFFFINRKIKTGWVFFAYIVISILAFLSIFYWKNFPDSYVEGQGLTQFKIISEYVISFIFLASIALLFKKKAVFNNDTFSFLVIAIFITILSEQSFTHYLSVYGFFNLLGHILKIVASYFLYKAIVVVGIERPQDLLYRKLKQSEEESRRATAKNKAILLSIADGLVATDKDKKTVFMNQAAEEISGWSEKEAMGKVWPELVSIQSEKGEKILPDESPVGIAIKRGKTVIDAAYFYIRKDKTIFPVAITASPIISDGETIGAIIVFRDITERKTIEFLLQKKAEENQVLIDSVPALVFYKDKENRFLRVNKYLENVTGMPKERLEGASLFDLYSKERAEAYWRDDLEVIRSGKPKRNIIEPLETPGGERIMQTDKIPYRDENGNIIGIIGFAIDVTERQRIDRMKSEFVALASHQLRTPLTAIRWIIERLTKVNGKMGKLSKKQRDYLDKVYDSNMRMLQLVQDLLNVSRLEEGNLRVEPRPRQFEDIIAAVIEENKDLAAKRQCGLYFEKPKEKLPMIPLDESLVRQVVGNLLVNAIRYSDPCAQVKIKLEKIAEDYLLAVVDNGIGIPSNEQSRIFTKFFRADRARKMHTEGSGLGLYIVKMIVELSGGKIWFESEENKGTTFYISWPAKGMGERDGGK